MAVFESQGVTLEILTVDSPATWTTVGQITSITGLRGGQATVIDVSTLASTRREKRMGLPDEGQVTVGLIFDVDDAGQSACATARAARSVESFRVDLNDAGSPDDLITFSGYVLSVPINANLDDVLRGEMQIEITGAVTIS